jgi:hypothetical protein
MLAGTRAVGPQLPQTKLDTRRLQPRQSCFPPRNESPTLSVMAQLLALQRHAPSDQLPLATALDRYNKIARALRDDTQPIDVPLLESDASRHELCLSIDLAIAALL